MDDLKALYRRIENPIDNKIKWNKLLNIYSTSVDFDDFYLKVNAKKKTGSCFYNEEDKNGFSLIMWSIWKGLLLSFSEEILASYIERKEFDSSIYEVVKKVRQLDSVKTITSLYEVLSNSDINRYFSKLFNEFNHDIIICSNFGLTKDPLYNTVLTVNVDAVNLYKFLKAFINECIKNEVPYYIRYNETGENVTINIYSRLENIKRNEAMLNILKKEHYTFFNENNNNLLVGNINEWIGIKHKEHFNNEDYLSSRSLIIFKSIDSVIYNYVVNHLNTLVSYKDGRMNLIEYLSNYVMEKVVENLVNANIKTSNDYFLIANSKDLINLKEYIKSKLSFGMKDILNSNLYLKEGNEKIDFRLNSNKSIGIEVNVFMCAIRNLVLTLMHKDNLIEKEFRKRIKNECQFHRVDSDKLCLDITFSEKLFFDYLRYDKYQRDLSAIHNEIAKIDGLDKLINSEITNDTREKISSSMNELLDLFED